MKTIEQILKEVGELDLVNEVSLPKVSTSLLNPTANCDCCKVMIIITLHDYLDEAYRWRKTITLRGMTCDQAKVEKIMIQRQVEEVIQASFSNKGKHELVESMSRWLDALEIEEVYRPSTINKMKEQFKVIEKYFTMHPIYVEDFKTSNANKFYNWALKEGRFKPSKDGSLGLAKSTVKALGQRLSGFFQFAIGNDIISINPIDASAIRYDQPDIVNEQRKCWLDEDEYEQFSEWLIQASKTKRYSHLAKLVEICDLMIYTGMRREELLGLKWDSFNYEKSTLTIKAVRVKTSTGDVYEEKLKSYPSYRVYTLTDRIRDLLQHIRERHQSLGIYNPDGFIFIWETGENWHLGKEYKTDYITPLFKTAIKACDVIDDKSLRFHHLRHSCCSIMCKLGYKKEDTQSWIGHADGSKVTDRVYNHYDRILDISKLQKYDEALTRKRSST